MVEPVMTQWNFSSTADGLIYEGGLGSDYSKLVELSTSSTCLR